MEMQRVEQRRDAGIDGDRGFPQRIPQFLQVELPHPLEAPVEFRELRAYVQAAYRINDRVSTSLYTSIYRNSTAGRNPSDDNGHQYDTAVSVRYDATPNVLLKAEAHAIDGYGATEGSLNRGMERASRWGLFLLKTTLTF